MLCHHILKKNNSTLKFCLKAEKVATLPLQGTNVFEAVVVVANAVEDAAFVSDVAVVGDGENGGSAKNKSRSKFN